MFLEHLIWKYKYNSGNMNTNVTSQSKGEKNIAQEGIREG